MISWLDPLLRFPFPGLVKSEFLAYLIQSQPVRANLWGRGASQRIRRVPRRRRIISQGRKKQHDNHNNIIKLSQVNKTQHKNNISQGGKAPRTRAIVIIIIIIIIIIVIIVIIISSSMIIIVIIIKYCCCACLFC